MVFISSFLVNSLIGGKKSSVLKQINKHQCTYLSVPSHPKAENCEFIILQATKFLKIFEKYIYISYIDIYKCMYIILQLKQSCIVCGVFICQHFGHPKGYRVQRDKSNKCPSWKLLENTPFPSTWNFLSLSLRPFLLYHILQRTWSKTLSITFGEIFLKREYSCWFLKKCIYYSCRLFNEIFDNLKGI